MVSKEKPRNYSFLEDEDKKRVLLKIAFHDTNG
jgi:hypothetical protein